MPLPSPRQQQQGLALITLLVGILVGMLLLGGSFAGIKWTNTEAFCISCHEMRDNAFAEYRGTIHDENRTGVRVVCADCHVPREPFPMIVRKVKATAELYHHFITGKIDTPEKYEEHRYDLAMRVWTNMKKTDSRECRNCHEVSAMSEFRQSERAQERHAEARDNNMTCIDCHYAIAHYEPDGELGPQDINVRTRN
ncbi:butanol dehydrogenase [Halomonas sp. DQ26W]|uniref:NapC/NirT family cytochrome c n=1 Tax=Halomonas sp. DQ26W TaxID=2282311 RepID=UPI000DF805FD|nr:NapC/NirT family cytochrome c [Halomonas sp. DQ26W]RDB44753.1 butanol dehydrogenase [Halomonas sp. DQ26W]